MSNRLEPEVVQVFGEAAACLLASEASFSLPAGGLGQGRLPLVGEAGGDNVVV